MINLFKIMGLSLSFISCGIIGIYQSSKIKRRKALLIEFQILMEQISTEIGYFKEPVPVVFQRILERDHSIHSNSSTTLILKQCLIEYQKDQSNDFRSIWNHAIEYSYANEPLKDEDIQIMLRCGTFLGQSDYQGQKGHFELLHTELNKQIGKAEENIRIKANLYQKAGFSVGAVIAIALL